MGNRQKKAAIISLYGNSNYGNKLQNYAVQEILRREGIDSVNIINVPCLNNKNRDISAVLKFYLKGIVQSIIKGDRIKDCVDPNDPKQRKENFLRFNEQIVNSKHFFSFNRLSEFKDYDYYFVGSDQIWNPQYGGLSDLDLLTFTQKKKIAISASFGIEKLPSSCETKVKQYLSTFDAISVREEAAKRIVEENTGRTDVEVLIDPTMMLCPEDWDRVIKKPKDLTNKRYVVCYFLGTLTDEYRTAISQLAEREECTIVDLSNAESP